ncbi:uncharacterized protein LOC132205761 [Neocloeon triangulifer]|uniref:uncharacterized protein LOC132205761 n=1 Tax=Neocloeon triangulifer TaxID=2078957 RepID=UPI00286F64A7|nr:uncharacterized protein LOC132205761 [Neocloeon triangulifer]
MSKSKKKNVYNEDVEKKIRHMQYIVHQKCPQEISPTELADKEKETFLFLKLVNHVEFLPYLPWIECCKDNKQSSDDVLSTRDSLLDSVLFTKNKLLRTLYVTQTLAMPEYADKELYNSQLLFCNKAKTEEDRIYDLTMATRTAFSIECSGLSFWSKVDEAARNNDESALMALTAFITNYSSKKLLAHRMQNPGKTETGTAEDFLFNEGVLWQLHFNPVLLNQWLVAAQNTLLFHRTKYICYINKSSSFPPQIAPSVQLIFVFFRDLQRRLNYGFALIGHQVKMFPEKDERVTKLIMEDVVAPCLASLKAFLLDDNNKALFEYLITALPGIIVELRARSDPSVENKEVFFHNENIHVDPDDELEESMYTFLYWVNSEKVIKPCFGDIRIKIEDLKAKINESKIFPLLDKALIYMNSLDKALSKVYLSDEVKVEDDTKSKFLKYLILCYVKNHNGTELLSITHSSCFLTLLLQLQKSIMFDFLSRTLSYVANQKTYQEDTAEKFNYKGEDLELNIRNFSIFEESGGFQRIADYYLKQWDGSSYIPETFMQMLDQAKPQNSIEERVYQLAKEMVCLETESNTRYPNWTFIYYILPALVNCFRKDSSTEFKHKLSVFFLEELVELFSKDHNAWKSRSDPADSTNNLLSGNPSYATSILAFRKMFLDRICSVVPKKFRTISTPIIKLNELLSQNAANNVPSADPAMTNYLHRFALDWTLKGAQWTNMIIFALTEGIARFGSLCASAEASPASSQLKSLLLAVYSMIELVSVFETESSSAKGCTFRLQTLEEVYLELVGGSKGKGKTAVTAWQRLGVLLHQLYEMCKTVRVPENFTPPNYYPEDTKLILKYFSQKDLRKLKLEIASMCINPYRENRTWVTLEDIRKPAEKLLFAPYLSRLDKEEDKIRSWDEDLLLPLKHCRFCGSVEENLVMCSFCDDDEEYPDVNWFCREECEDLAMKKCQHNEEHDKFIIEKICI